jgi:hypothetical protein
MKAMRRTGLGEEIAATMRNIQVILAALRAGKLAQVIGIP